MTATVKTRSCSHNGSHSKLGLSRQRCHAVPSSLRDGALDSSLEALGNAIEDSRHAQQPT